MKKNLKKTAKIFSFTILLAIFIMLCLFYKSIAADIYCQLAEYHIIKNDYKAAYEYLNNAIQFDKKEKYYIKASELLLELPQTVTIQKELFKFQQSDRINVYTAKINQELYNIYYRTTKGSEKNYIHNATTNGKILRWSIERKPLKIFFGSSVDRGVPAYYPKEILAAFRQWAKLLDLKYGITETYDEADIKFIFSDDLISAKNKKLINYGLTIHNIEKDILNDVIVKIIVSYNRKYLTRIQLYNVALHEIGHTLGIAGHSLNKKDVMYPIAQDIKGSKYTGIFKRKRIRFSQRDINTIKLLYKIHPEISNVVNDPNTSKLAYSQIILGNKQLTLKNKLKEAKNYIDMAPKSPASWMFSGNIAIDNGKFHEALQHYTKALSLSSEVFDKSSLLYNIAFVHFKMHNYEEAINYLNKSLASNPNALHSKELLAYIYLKQNNLASSEKYYKELISKKPSSIDYSYNLATLYVHNFQFIKAAKVTKKLLEHNPAAQNHNKIRTLLPLVYLFMLII